MQDNIDHKQIYTHTHTHRQNIKDNTHIHAIKSDQLLCYYHIECVAVYNRDYDQ